MAERISQADFDALVTAPTSATSGTGIPQYRYQPVAMNVIKRKLEAASGIWGKKYQIEVTDYDTVYITSDIHADARKLIDLLQKENIIYFVGADVDSSSRIKVNTDAIYNNVENIRWHKSKTLLILVGDLVDGRRVIDDTEVNDPRGYMELLLHAYLYNLRVSAKDKASEVLFTIGNHEYFTLIDDKTTNFHTGYKFPVAYIENYVHTSARTFFDMNKKDTGGIPRPLNFESRAESLLAFYQVSPFIFLILKKNTSIEVACIHAGFHSKWDYITNKAIPTEEKMTPSLVTLQEKVSTDSSKTFKEHILSYDKQHLFVGDGDIGGLMNRDYAMTDSCDLLKKYQNTMVVVGHCPTNSGNTFPYIDSILETGKDTTYNGCARDSQSTEKGCVVIGCQDVHGPHLAFVDVGMSAAFRNATANQGRNAEFLLLEHNGSSMYASEPRHYNVISRKPAGPNEGVTKKRIMWEQKGGGPLASGASEELFTLPSPSGGGNSSASPPGPPTSSSAPLLASADPSSGASAADPSLLASGSAGRPPPRPITPPPSPPESPPESPLPGPLLPGPPLPDPPPSPTSAAAAAAAAASAGGTPPGSPPGSPPRSPPRSPPGSPPESPPTSPRPIVTPPGPPLTPEESSALSIIGPILPAVATYISTLSPRPVTYLPSVSGVKQTIIENTRFIQKPTVEALPYMLAMLPALATYISTTAPRKESRFYSGLKGATSGILNSGSSLMSRITAASKPKPKAITAELMADKTPWNLAKPTLQAPDMKRLATLELPTKSAHHDIPSGIPAWVPKTVAAELDLNPECDRGGFVGPTCLPTTMHKHILELEDYNENRSFSKGAFWKSSRDKFKAAKEKQPKSTPEQKEFDAKYPETYSFYVKDTSGNVPSVVSVFSPYHTMDERKAGKFRSTNLAALARIAPPEMIFSEKNKSEQVKDMTIALLESLAFCGSKKTLDDPDCEPLRILAEIREFHAGQRAALAKQQTDESRRLTGPWAPIERIIRLIEGYVPTKRDRGTIDVKEEPRPVVAKGSSGGPGGPTNPVVPPSASAFYMPTIPFRIPLPFSASFSSPELSLPSLFGTTNFSTRI